MFAEVSVLVCRDTGVKVLFYTTHSIGIAVIIHITHVHNMREKNICIRDIN